MNSHLVTSHALTNSNNQRQKGFFAKSLYAKQYPYKTFINSGIILYRPNNE